MIDSNSLTQFLGISIGNLPTVLACLVAIVVILSRGQQIGAALPWAVLGFVLALVVSFAGPFSQVWLRGYFVSHALSFTQNGWMFSVLAVFNSLVHAAALIFLLVAIFSGRTPPIIPPPFPRV